MKTFNRILCLIIITVIIGITIPAHAERIKYSGVARTSSGTVLGTATVSTYLAGTTTPAGVYTASSGGAAVYSVTSDTGGRFTFYVDTADYGFVQQFKVVATKDGYETVSLDNIYELQLPTDAAGYLRSNGAGAYSWADGTFDEAGDYVLTGTWDFSGATVTLPPIAVLYLESSDVTQPVTSILDTNQFAGFFKIDSSLGGLDVYGITDGDAPYGALRLTGITGDETPTEEYAPLVLRAGKANSTGWQALGNTESALQLYNYTTLLWMVYGNGETSFSSLQNTPVGTTTAAAGKFTTLQTNGANTFTKVNAAGASQTVLTLSGTLGEMDGSKTFKGIFLDYDNAGAGSHTATDYTYGIYIDSITNSDSNEYGIYIGTGFDTGLSSASPMALVARQPFYFYDTDSSAYVGFRAPDAVTTSYLLDLPAAAPTSEGLPLVCNNSDSKCSFATGLSNISIGAGIGAASRIAEYDVSGNLSYADTATTGTGAPVKAVTPTLTGLPKTNITFSASNGTYSGTSLYFAQCAASMGFGQPAYIQSTGKPGLADADAAATMPAIGLVVVASTDADTPCTILTHGVITNTTWNWTTVGATIYVADGDAGALTATIGDISDTNDVVQVMGIALHADTIFLNPSLTTIVLE